LRIYYFYQYFSTSAGSWGTRVHEFVKEWLENDEQLSVKLITSLYYKSDLTSNRFISTQNIDNISVEVLGIKVNNKDSFIKRIFSFVGFSLFSSIYALFGNYDVAIASSGPITVGLPGLIAKKIRRKKLVFEVRDLWPQGAIELGVIKSSWMIRLARWFELCCYRNADLIITLSPGMRDEVLQKVPKKRVISITNAANIQLFGSPKDFPIQNADEIQQEKYALYAGNIGKVNNVEWMYNSAMLLTRYKSAVKVVIIGDGQLKLELQERKIREGNDNLIFLPLMPKTELVTYMQHALVSLVPLANTPVLETSSPNKLFESLAAAVPVVITTKGWMYDFIVDNEFGYYIDSNKPESLAELLMQIQPISEEQKQRIRNYAEINFDKKNLAKEFITAINEIN